MTDADADIPPDGVVRTALQLLPIPSHADDFWARLEHSLDAEDVPRAAVPATRSVAVAEPPTQVVGTVVDLVDDPALALVPGALRRSSNALLLAVAAAAFAVVAVAGTTLLDEGDGTQVTSDDELQASAGLDDLVEDAQPEESTPSTMSASGEATSSDAVLAWVDDLGTGDSEAAWEAMGPASQAHFGSQAAFEEQLTDLAEGYGAWSVADPDEVLVTPVLSSDEGILAVVTLVGTVDQEGATEHRADAFPVRIVAGEAVLEPFAFAGELEVVVPEAVPDGGVRPPMEPGEEIVIVVPNGAEAPVLRLDDGAAVICGLAEGTQLTPLDKSPGQRCSYLPADGISAGEHTLTMAFLGSDGASISAESLLFEAA